MAVQAAPKTNGAADDDKKRAEGPVKISYVGANGEAHDRVPDDVKFVRVLDRIGNKAKDYPMDKVPPLMLLMHAAQGIGKRFDIGARNSYKADPAASITLSSDELFVNILAGKFSSRGEGKGGPGRSFDFEKWVWVWQSAYNSKRKGNPKIAPWTDVASQRFQTKLEAMEPAPRRQWIKEQLAADPVFSVAEAEYKLMVQKQAAKAVAKDAKDAPVTDSFADLF